MEGGLWLQYGAPNAFNHHQIFCDYDPQLGWQLKPNVSQRRVTPEYDHVETINADGFRDRRRERAKTPQTRRIAVLGDSFVEGYSVGDEQTFTRALERKYTTAARRPVEVFNLGVGGYSTDQQLLLWRNKGRQLRPDLVVLAFFRNDVAYNALPTYARGPKPLFAVVDGQLAADAQPPGPQPARQIPQGWHRWTSKLGTVSHTWFHLRALRRRLLSNPQADENPLVFWRDELFVPSDQPQVSAAWRATELLLDRLASEVRATGAEFVVMWVPDSELIADSSEGKWGVRDKLKAVGARSGFSVLDPRAALRDHPEQPVYYKRDRHWNAAGHEAVADFLFDALGVPQAATLTRVRPDSRAGR